MRPPVQRTFLTCLYRQTFPPYMYVPLFCFWRRQSVVFLFLYEISPEPLNRFAPNSHRRRVWSVAWTNLKLKGQGHQGQKNGIFQPFRQPACGLCLVKHLQPLVYF